MAFMVWFGEATSGDSKALLFGRGMRNILSFLGDSDHADQVLECNADRAGGVDLRSFGDFLRDRRFEDGSGDYVRARSGTRFDAETKFAQSFMSARRFSSFCPR